MRDINFQISEDEMDALMDEIQDSSGTVDYARLSKLVFARVDTQPGERAHHRARMGEIKTYFARRESP